MKIDLVRAWKDPEYRKSLTAEQLASLPPNPAGAGELSDAELHKAAGGLAEEPGHSIFWCPPPITQDKPLC
jgi:mersacidin/lichenicidin family type 2 lantibiotic